MNRVRFASLLLPLFVALAVSPTAAKSDLDAELDSLIAAWVGEYTPAPDTLEGYELYTFVREVDLPTFGNRVLYFELRQKTRDGEVQRQRIFSFDTTPDRSANSMLSFDFLDGAPFAGAYDNPEKLAILNKDQMRPFESVCQINWRSENASYLGEVRAEDCILTSERRGTDIKVGLLFEVQADAFESREYGYSLDGEPLFGNADGPPVRSVRVE